ncbi:MAG: hypothetical protein MK033_00705 [Candidatus Caenarcaniphilales bacterium]|nr:hypothetical protein [Candidatus Caenarcaniphilales bacterium]
MEKNIPVEIANKQYLVRNIYKLNKVLLPNKQNHYTLNSFSSDCDQKLRTLVNELYEFISQENTEFQKHEKLIKELIIKSNYDSEDFIHKYNFDYKMLVTSLLIELPKLGSIDSEALIAYVYYSKKKPLSLKIQHIQNILSRYSKLFFYHNPFAYDALANNKTAKEFKEKNIAVCKKILKLINSVLQRGCIL